MARGKKIDEKLIWQFTPIVQAEIDRNLDESAIHNLNQEIEEHALNTYALEINDTRLKLAISLTDQILASKEQKFDIKILRNQLANIEGAVLSERLSQTLDSLQFYIDIFITYRRYQFNQHLPDPLRSFRRSLQLLKEEDLSSQMKKLEAVTQLQKIQTELLDIDKLADISLSGPKRVLSFNFNHCYIDVQPVLNSLKSGAKISRFVKVEEIKTSFESYFKTRYREEKIEKLIPIEFDINPSADYTRSYAQHRTAPYHLDSHPTLWCHDTATIDASRLWSVAITHENPTLKAIQPLPLARGLEMLTVAEGRTMRNFLDLSLVHTLLPMPSTHPPTLTHFMHFDLLPSECFGRGAQGYLDCQDKILGEAFISLNGQQPRKNPGRPNFLNMEFGGTWTLFFPENHLEKLKGDENIKLHFYLSKLEPSGK